MLRKHVSLVGKYVSLAPNLVSEETKIWTAASVQQVQASGGAPLGCVLPRDLQRVSVALS